MSGPDRSQGPWLLGAVALAAALVVVAEAMALWAQTIS